MNQNRFVKIGSILVLFFCMALLYGSINIRVGGSIFGHYSNLFYPLLIIAIIFLICASALKADYAKLFIASILIIGLYLILFIGIGDRPFDLDSIISAGSLDFILSQRYPSIFDINSELFIRATIAYPMFSFLAVTLELITGWSDIIVSKNLPLILSILFIFIYFSFIKKYLGFKVALISLILLSTFELMSSVANSFINVALADIYIVVGWLIFYRLLSSKLSISHLLLLVYISLTFLLVHHLTLLAFILSILAIMPIISTKLWSTKLGFNAARKIALVILFSVFLLGGLFLIGPVFSIITNTLTGKYSMIPVSYPSTWPFKLIVMRASYLLFVLTSLAIYASLAIRNRSWLATITAKYSSFLIPGGFLIFCSIMIILIGSPFGYERLAIFGWMLFIPGTICMLLQESSKNRVGLRLVSIILIVLIIGNIYQIPISHIDHSDDTEYLGTFKNWVKPQEVSSVLWMIGHNLNSGTIMGDELIWRLYNMNSLDFNGYWWSGNFSFSYITEDYNRISDLKGYLLIRQENFHRFIQSFGSREPKEDFRIEMNEYNDLIKSSKHKLIYDNGEVAIFSPYE
jgi:hypothetical protein